MVLATELTPASLIESLEAGRFYSSSGVTLEKVEATAKSLTVTVRPDADATYTIDFIGTRKELRPEERTGTRQRWQGTARHPKVFTHHRCRVEDGIWPESREGDLRRI